MSKINLCVIATAKYTDFLPQFLESAAEHFMGGHEVKFCIFTDKVQEVCKIVYPRVWNANNVYIFEIEHKPWPYPTLHRFHFFLEHKSDLPDADYLFYCDVDSRFVAPIGEEILGDLVAVQHCGFIGERGTYETRPQSMAYIPPHKGEKYFGGGFLGGESTTFWMACCELAQNIDIDERNGITAIHNDESHWNKLLVDSPPTVILSPDYHYPETPEKSTKWARLGLSFEPKILLLNKDHKEIRA